MEAAREVSTWGAAQLQQALKKLRPPAMAEESLAVSSESFRLTVPARVASSGSELPARRAASQVDL